MIRFLKIDSSNHLMRYVYSIRYEVYCLECGFEDSLRFKSEIEFDEYDLSAIHFIAFDDTNAIGTVRMVFSSEGFPLEKHCKIEHIKLPYQELAEISRLAVLKQYRNSEIYLGLWRAVYQESKRLEIFYWYVFMEKKLFRLLRKYGIIFEQIGKGVDYNGLRIPFFAKIDVLEQSMAKNKPELFNYFIKEK